MPDIRTMPDGLGNCKGNLIIDRTNPNLPANRYILSRARDGLESALPAALRVVDRDKPIPATSVALETYGRCRTASYSKMPAVTETFSDEILPANGNETIASQAVCTRGRTPEPSAPSTKMQPSR